MPLFLRKHTKKNAFPTFFTEILYICILLTYYISPIMKTKYIILSTILITTAAGMVSCRNQNKAQSENGKDSTATAMVSTPDTALYGKLGEGTGMSCVEIITDQGDTLTLNKTDENTGAYGKILGGTERYNDPLTITTDANRESIITLVNLNTLTRKWQTHPDSIQMNLAAKGKISGKWNGRGYRRWAMCNAQFVVEFSGNGTVSADTFEIQDLSQDSLILKNRNAIYKFYSK